MNQHETKQTGAALRLSVYLILIAALLLPASRTTAQAAPVQQDTPVQQVGAAAVGTTYTVTSTSCTGPGTITEAIALANANPGEDTIVITPNLVIDAFLCQRMPPPSENYFAQVTESVTIEGNGATLGGAQAWVTSGGLITPLSCPDQPNDVITGVTPGFLQVGQYGQSNPDLEVVIKNLNLYELAAIAVVEIDAKLTLDGVKAKRILSAPGCITPAINVDKGGSLTLINNDWDTVFNWQDVVATYATSPAIASAEDAGTLNIVNSLFYLTQISGFISWWGGDVNIVSTQMLNTGGIIHFGPGNTNIVNSPLDHGGDWRTQ